MTTISEQHIPRDTGGGWIAFWINRNGQHHWDGPHAIEGAAWGVLSMTLDKSGGYGVAHISEWRKPDGAV